MKNAAIAETEAILEFPMLLSPIQLGPLELQSRVVMGAMHTRLETQPNALEREIAFYRSRAEGGVGLIISGGISPSEDGVFEPGALATSHLDHAYQKELTTAVRDAGSPFIAQLLHAGRYAKIPELVAPSPIAAPINKRTPRGLTSSEVESLVDGFAMAAETTLECGYDGVEIMGSEGYLINQFLASRSNQRDDAWGGDWTRRKRFAVEIVRAVKRITGDNKLLSFRISALELVEHGMTQVEILDLAHDLQAAGIDVFNTGIGWHESRIPTVAQVTPRGAFADAIIQLKQAVQVPVMASNRINTPELAEEILASSAADLVSLCRPLLADADFVRKTAQGRGAQVVPCVACNQACLDRIFVAQAPSCIVNPRAAREIDFSAAKTTASKTVAVVGGGAAGLTAAIEAAANGHDVTLYEASSSLGGLLNLASQIPGKGEFETLLSSMKARAAAAGVNVKLNTRATVDLVSGYDHVIIATGVRPRLPAIDGINHSTVVTYEDILSRRRTAGQRVAIIGAGGIGFDAAEFLVDAHARFSDIATFRAHYGLSTDPKAQGGIDNTATPHLQNDHDITLMQRSGGRMGRTLSITTSWIKRDTLNRAGVRMLDGVDYRKINDDGVHITRAGETQVIAADTVILCAGQSPERGLVDALTLAGVEHEIIGGAEKAAELDAMRAIEQGVRAALAI